MPTLSKDLLSTRGRPLTVTTNWHLPDINGEQLTERELLALTRITESFSEHPGYRHRLWDWLASADYELVALQTFAELYYGHVRQFRKYLAGAITVSSNELVQASLAEILAEEYGRRYDPLLGTYGPSHPDLYRRFMRSIDLVPEDFDCSPPIPSIRAYYDVHYNMFQGGREIETMGAVIFAMESTTPYRHEKVTSGLSKFAPKCDLVIDDTFFSRHVEIDPRHGQSLLMPARAWLDDPIAITALMKGAELSFDARAKFLDEIMDRSASQSAL